ncbi:MAG TPA: TIGR01841 family phasin [Noviherbaspirillum sp.]|nr:TIGR01841 family phasin [Noviherbaspirillum sp.]
MFPIHDQMSVTTKASLETTLAMYSAFTGAMLGSAEKLIKLNLSTIKAVLEDASAVAGELLAVKDPAEYFSLVRAQAKPNINRAIAYGGHFATIVRMMHSDFSNAAETQIGAVSRKVNELVEQTVSKAPVGSEAMMAVVKSAFGNTGNGYEQLTRTAKQAMDALTANLNGVVSSSQAAQAQG